MLRYILIPVGLFYLFTNKIVDLSPGTDEYNIAGLIASVIMIAATFAERRSLKTFVQQKSAKNPGKAIYFWIFIFVGFIVLLLT